MSTSILMNMSVQAMFAAQAQIATAGHNIVNASVKGYSRQEVKLGTMAGQETSAGYIGRGVSVHRADCINVRDIVANEPERLVEVAWAGDASGTFSAEIQIIAYDHAGLLADLSLRPRRA